VLFYPVGVVSATEGTKASRSKGERTRAAILERAVDLASVEGLEGLTIGRLAADLGMSKSGLFAHFGSKLDLQLATVAAAAERFVAMVIAPSLDAPDGAPRLRAMAEHYFDYIATFEGGCFWGSTASEYDDRPGPVRDAIAASMEAWIAELVRQSKAAGIADPDRYAFELYAVVMGANSRYRLSGDRHVFDLARAALARLEAELPA
jgi:AcrR family transcriptional regulator